MHRDTRIVHAGYRGAAEPGAFRDGPQFSSTYTTPGEPSAHAFTYGRFHNPTWSAWEAALAELEGGECVSFASGMAAVAAVLGTTLKPGDVLVLPDDGYYTVRLLASNWLSPFGVIVRTAPTRGSAQANALDGATLLWMETPSNPMLDVCDIAHLAGLARARGVATVVDNTTATAYLQRPLDLGATYVVSSDTKALTGHSDLLLGHVATADGDRLAALRTWRTQHGAIAGPMEVWLAHRSLATLPLRIRQQCATAAALARRLATHPAVASVHYPGLPDHPGHAIARRQMDMFGTIVSFDLASRPRAERFLRSLALVREATSFGGVHSMAERRARWGADAVGEGFIRFSVGCEAAEDVIDDVGRALDAAAAEV
jgi:cystathionine gamma-lyase